MATVTVIPDRQLFRMVTRQPGIRQAIRDAAEDIAVKARVNLAAVRDEGDTRITVEHKSDRSVVYRDDRRGDRGAAAAEFGHTTESGSEVPGQYVLYRAAGLISA